MRYEVDPRQNRLFDSFAPVLSDVAYRYLAKTWYGVFREVILEFMPVNEIGRHFDPGNGRPTKELYSMAGLIFIMEFMDWTVPDAVHAYMFDNAVHYALNLEPAKQSLSKATIERYQRLFRENDIARRVFDDVTAALVGALELDVSRQRLDSTHLTSNMANFGRTRLLAVTIKRFLTQLKRHDVAAYEALPQCIRDRYDLAEKKLFSKADAAGRKSARQECAEDLLLLIERFADDEKHNGRQTYQMLRQVFDEQCEVEEGKVVVKKKTGGDVIQNPSDPDATYDGHKGPGYQAQAVETCSKSNEVQLILEAEVETAVKSDQDAVEPMLEKLECKGILPERLEADAGYGRDENSVLAEERCVDLQSPVPGKTSTDANDPYRLSIDDFVVNPETKEVVRCPAGHEPLSSSYDEEKGAVTTFMPNEACAGCEFGAECPIKRVCGDFRLKHTPKDLRLAERRREQATEAFQENYAVRAQIEGTFSGNKRKTGLGKLRVRGLSAVKHSVLLRFAGWNILRAAASTKMRERIQATLDERRACGSLSSPLYGAFRHAVRHLHRIFFGGPRLSFEKCSRRQAHFAMDSTAMSSVAA